MGRHRKEARLLSFHFNMKNAHLLQIAPRDATPSKSLPLATKFSACSSFMLSILQPNIALTKSLCSSSDQVNLFVQRESPSPGCFVRDLFAGGMLASGFDFCALERKSVPFAPLLEPLLEPLVFVVVACCEVVGLPYERFKQLSC